MPFNGLIILIAFIGLLYGLRAVLGMARVAKDAAHDYAYKKDNAMVDVRLSEEDYIKTYRRVHNPRSAAYIALTILGVFVITPISMTVFEYVYTVIYNVSGQSRVIEPGFLVWKFFIFFFLIANCAVIAYFMARHYHRNTPGSLQAEMDRAAQQSLNNK